MAKVSFTIGELHLLKKARETYGNANQILVSAEECCELAKELLKYPRYSTDEAALKNTYDKVLDERADLEIVLNHIDNIYHFDEDTLTYAVTRKLKRLKKWLDTSNSMETTTKIRSLESDSRPEYCSGCFYNDHWEEGFYEGHCKECVNGSNRK